VNLGLKPSKTFSSIYGEAFIFMSRTSPNATRWQPHGEMILDMMTSSMLTVLGDMPVVCAASVSTSDALNLLRDTGFQLPCEIHRYVDVADYMRMLQSFAPMGRKWWLSTFIPLSEMPPEVLLD